MFQLVNLSQCNENTLVIEKTATPIGPDKMHNSEKTFMMNNVHSLKRKHVQSIVGKNESIASTKRTANDITIKLASGKQQHNEKKINLRREVKSTTKKLTNITKTIAKTRDKTEEKANQVQQLQDGFETEKDRANGLQLEIVN